jgi:hypothetical protein
MDVRARRDAGVLGRVPAICYEARDAAHEGLRSPHHDRPERQREHGALADAARGAAAGGTPCDRPPRRADLDGRHRGRGGHHQADRLPALRRPAGARARAARLGVRRHARHADRRRRTRPRDRPRARRGVLPRGLRSRSSAARRRRLRDRLPDVRRDEPQPVPLPPHRGRSRLDVGRFGGGQRGAGRDVSGGVAARRVRGPHRRHDGGHLGERAARHGARDRRLVEPQPAGRPLRARAAVRAAGGRPARRSRPRAAGRRAASRRSVPARHAARWRRDRAGRAAAVSPGSTSRAG